MKVWRGIRLSLFNANNCTMRRQYGRACIRVSVAGPSRVARLSTPCDE